MQSKLKLEEMFINEYIKTSITLTRVYDGSPKQIFGTLEVKLYIEPHVFLMRLQVMDNHHSYSLLLGKPLIYKVRALTISFHQSLKYNMNEMLATVEREHALSRGRWICYLVV